MPIAEDEGLGMWPGLNALTKKSFLSEYSSRVNHQPHRKLLQSIVQAREKAGAYPSLSFNLDFHTIRHYGDPEGNRPRFPRWRDPRPPGLVRMGPLQGLSGAEAILHRSTFRKWLPQHVPLTHRKVLLYHGFCQFGELDLGVPMQLRAGPCGVRAVIVGFEGAVKLRAHTHQDLTGF